MADEGEMNELLAAQLVPLKHILGAVNSLVFKCALKLNILDAIHRHAKPITLTELGTSLSVPPANLSILHRIMRYLVHMKIITVIKNNKQVRHALDTNDEVVYAIAPAAKLLLEGELSLAPFAKLILDEGHLSAMHALDLCVYGDLNTTTYEKVKGESLWAHALRDPVFNKLFNEGMTSRTTVEIGGIVEACREGLEGIRTLVDVGGGVGTTAQAIVGAFPHLHCTVLDLPHVVEGLPELPGIEYVGGDMFASIPPADAALLMSVLHDWNDDQCIQILEHIKVAIPRDGGKLLIVDKVIKDDQAEKDDQFYNTVLASDVLMLVANGGKEMTEKEWKQLLIAGAGFSGYKMTPIWGGVMHVIEAHL